MSRKLYIVPKIPLHLKISADPTLKEMKHTINAANKLYEFEASGGLRGKKIDKIFIEGTGIVTWDDLPGKPSYIQLLNIHGSRFEKTESRGSSFLYGVTEFLDAIPKVGDFFYKISNKIKSYAIAKHISKSLKDGETGLMEVQVNIFPEAYIRLLAPDIGIEYVRPRKDVKKTCVEILEGKKTQDDFRIKWTRK